MSQAQTQITPVKEEEIPAQHRFTIFTWGSCRRGYLEILYPQRINLAQWTRYEGIHEVEIPGICKIRYENRDSRKNTYRVVEIIDIYTPMVIRNYGSRSCGHGFEGIYIVKKENGKIIYEEPEVKTEVVVEERGKYRVTAERRYVEVGNEKVYIDVNELEKEVCVEKLKVTLKRLSDRIVAIGDTYYVKEILKAFGFWWDPVSKAWHNSPKIDINKLVLKLEQTGVQVEVQ